MDRRLTTIVAADMVGYSRLMAEDEEGTLDRLRAARKDVIDPEIAAAGGRIVKTMGDGLLVEFPSPVEAVRAVIAVQSAMAPREADRAPEQRIEFRVGVNLGDVIIDGDDIMGDGVNIAARLEGLAESGGIVISHSVHEQVKGKVDCGFTDLGPQQVKNIPDPVNAYAIALDGVAAHARPKRRKPLMMAIAAVLLLGFAIGGYLMATRPTDALADLPPVQEPVDVASLIVLPFQDYSEDQSLDYFADGMTEDLITDLARWKEFRVMARNTSMTYKDKPVDVRDVARETGAQYVLEGSVRRIGGQMRITAQLIDGETGGHIWAERFEETGDDILALQDSVIKKTVQTLIGDYGVIRENEYAKTWAKAKTDLEEYDYYLRGHSQFYRFSAEGMAEAIAIWAEGAAKYPESGLLKIKLGWGHASNASFGFTKDPKPYAELLELTLEGMADPNLPPAGHRFGLWLVARLNTELGNRAAAIEAVDSVVSSYPFDAEGLVLMASELIDSGEFRKARLLFDRADDLDFTLAPVYRSRLGQLYYVEENCKQAIPDLEAFAVRSEVQLFLAGCYAETGRTDEASGLLQKIEDQFGIIGPDGFPARFANMPGVTERLTAQLKGVGWPE